MTHGATQTWWDRLVPSSIRFGSQGVSVIGIRIAGAALGLVAQVLASRLIGPQAFGQYALVLVWLLLLGHGATAGTNQLVCRFVAQYLHRDDPGHAAGLLRFSLLFAGGVAALLIAVAVLVVQIGPFGIDPQFALLATLAFAAVPLIALQDFLEAIARGLDKPNLGIAPAFLLRHLAIIVGVLCLMALGTGADAVAVVAMTIAGLAASVLIQWLLLARHIRKALGGAPPRYQTRYWIRTALPIALVEAAEVLFHNADILILWLFVSPDIVAFYFAATRLAQILGYVPYGISAVTAQKYAALVAANRRSELQGLVSAATSFSTLAALGAALVLSVGAVPLLSLFGDAYVAAAAIVPILCTGVVLTCLLGPGEDVLTMLGQERICSVVFVVAVLANLGLNFALIPAFGMTGAAVATVLALSLRGALLAYFAHARLGLALPLGSQFLAHQTREIVS
jgi:O-antigen/teichoic acid export membrane protein